MKNLFFFLIPIYLLSCSNRPKTKIDHIIPPSPLFSDIRSEIIQHLSEKSINSFAVAVVHNDSILWKECINRNPLNDSIEISSDAIFPVASLSKSMSAVLMHNLHENKIINLNENLNHIEHLKGMNLAKNAKVKDLLSMTAGIPHGWMFLSKNVNPTTIKVLDSLLNTYKFSAFKKGTHEYSNYSFGIAEQIMENSAGKKYEHLIDSRLFKPLKMNESFVGNQFIDTSYGDYLNTTKAFNFYPKAAAGIYASLEDVMKFGSFLKNGNADVLSNYSLESLKYEKVNNELIIAQGIGNINISVDVTWLVSNGSFSFPITSNSNLSVIPEKSLTIICLADKDYNSLADIMAIKIADKKIPGFMDKAFSKMENHDKFNSQAFNQFAMTSKKWKAFTDKQNSIELKFNVENNELLYKTSDDENFKHVDYLNIAKEGILRFGTILKVRNPFSNAFENLSCNFNIKLDSQNLEGYYSVNINKENEYFLSLPTKVHFKKND